MNKPRKQYAVLTIHLWSDLIEDGRPVRMNFKPGMPVGFLPVFATREDAEAWPGEIIEMMSVKED